MAFYGHVAEAKAKPYRAIRAKKNGLNGMIEFKITGMPMDMVNNLVTN